MTLEQPPNSPRILVGSSASLTSYKRGSDGEPINPGTTTVTVTRADGEVVATGAATTEAASYELTYALSAANNTQLEWLTAVWTDADGVSWTTYYEVVGGFWFTRAQAIQHDSTLADGAKYPPERISAVRAEVETEFEHVTNTAWVPRYRRVQLIGNNSCDLIPPNVLIRSVRSVRAYSADMLTYESFTANDLAAIVVKPWGGLHRPDGWTRNVVYVVEYEHGADQPPPDLRDAAITRLRHRLNMHRSGIPDRATSQTTESGQTYSLATPGLRGFVTGIPDVDVVLTRYTHRRFAIA